MHSSALFWACLASCAPQTERAPVEQAVAPVLLARHPELLQAVELPADSRGGAEVRQAIPVNGPFQLRRTVGGVHSFETDLPIRLRSLFFSRPPPGLELWRGEKKLSFRRTGRSKTAHNTWSFTARKLQLHLDTDEPPADGAFSLRYERAVERECRLNRECYGQELAAAIEGGADEPPAGGAQDPGSADRSFMLRSAQQGDTSRYGVLLPAPARASWRVTVPAGGHLSVEAGMLQPEVADLEPSDGARLLVSLEAAKGGGPAQQVLAVMVEPGQFELTRVDLSAWGGQEVELSFVSEPLGNALADYVFVGEPTVYVPLQDPPVAALLFVDTLRRDRLGLYGYDRPTTPQLEEWAREAVVFDRARTPSPWTLPSARALLLGAEPEFWGVQDTLPALLARAGWATASFVGNVYLSANFDMSGDWGTHFVENWPRADDQTDRVLEWLEAHDDRPAVAMVHLMDTHLPYTEPRRYRMKWAGTAPEGLKGSFLRSSVTSAARGKGKKEAREYVQDRYDGSIRYVDDQLARVLEVLGDDDIAVFFSDHGEEFWDHGGFEHGHTVYEELLRVPLAIKAPGLPAGRVEQRVTLMDLAPTLLELLGAAPGPDMKGLSMVPLAQGDGQAVARFEERKHGFGRPLYGDEQWGVVHDEQKYSTQAGRESLFDLDEDPQEKRDLVKKGRGVDLATLRAGMGEALDRSVHVALRLKADRSSSKDDLQVQLTVPGGVAEAWVGVDATKKSEASVSFEGEVANVVWKGGNSGSCEVFVVPVGPLEQAAAGLSMEARRGERSSSATVEKEPPAADGRVRRLLRTKGGGIGVTVTWGVAPQPPEGGAAVEGYDSEVREALRALGYVE